MHRAAVVMMLRSQWGAACHRLVRWSSDYTDIDGLAVAIPENRDVDQAMRRLEEGLVLIDAQAPWVLTHARSTGVRIFLRLRGEPRPSFGDVVVGTDWLVQRPATYVASSLVHQFVLARLRRVVPPWRNDSRMRVTRVVLERRIAFCRGLPDGAYMVQQLTDAWDDGYYNAERVAEGQTRRMADTLAELEDLGAPQWVRRLLGIVAQWTTRH